MKLWITTQNLWDGTQDAAPAGSFCYADAAGPQTTP